MTNKVLILLPLLVVSFVTDARAQIEAVFTKHSEFQLPENHLIGSIVSLDVLNGSYLITDFQKQLFHYQEGEGDLQKLDPRDCFPGFKLQPIHVFHLLDGSIFLMNAGQPGYRFQPNGDCLNSVHKDFIQVSSQHIEIDESGGGFYTVRTLPNEEVVLNHYDNNGKPIEKFELGRPEFPQFNFRFLGGGIALHEKVIYYVPASGKSLMRFDMQKRKLLENIDFRPSYASPISEDIPTDPFSGEMSRAIGDIMSEHYVVRSVFKLSEGILLIQTSFSDEDKRKYGIHLFDLKLQQQVEEVIIEQPIIFARDNNAYQINDMRELDGDVLNPGVTIYELIGQ